MKNSLNKINVYVELNSQVEHEFKKCNRNWNRDSTEPGKSKHENKCRR